MTAKKSIKSTKPRKTNSNSTDNKSICFVISPIGSTGTEKYKKFKDVLDYLIKPAVKNSGYSLEVIRADDIERPGSFIKDILDSLLNSFVVIADLTDQNPNVFYELGVRHALSPRTILIAQSIDHIPSDLREYRAIVYDTSLEGAAIFSKRLSGFIKQIFADQHRSDNPVLDRLQSIIEQKTITLENENAELKKQTSNLLKKGSPTIRQGEEELAIMRVERILTIEGGELAVIARYTRRIRADKEIAYKLPTSAGKFNLYNMLYASGTIRDYWFVAVDERDVDVEKHLADVRVLMQQCSQGQDVTCKFVIATNDDLSKKRTLIIKAFNKMKTFLKPEARKLFNLQIWDKKGLLAKEKQLGLKIDVT